MEKTMTSKQLAEHLNAMFARAAARGPIDPLSRIGFGLHVERILGEFDATEKAFFCGVVYRRAA